MTNPFKRFERLTLHMKRGEQHPAAKLTERQVRDIRAAVAAGEKRAVIAARFGVSTQTIMRIARGQTWRHVQ